MIVGGEYANIKKVPWHVGIYRQTSTDSDFVQQCGGTIINPKVVISAAHCFWNREEHKPNREDEYRVVAGKYFRDFNDRRENNTYQTLGVDKVHFVNGYIDYEGFYANDIAIVILNNFIEYKIHVAPICIQEYTFEEKIVPHGNCCRLGSYTICWQPKWIQREDCLKKFDESFRPFLTSDKFCAGYLLGVGVCRGDSGGGLVFPKIVNGKTVYYLRGIVSAGQNKGGSCDSDRYAVFTNIAH